MTFKSLDELNEEAKRINKEIQEAKHRESVEVSKNCKHKYFWWGEDFDADDKFNNLLPDGEFSLKFMCDVCGKSIRVFYKSFCVKDVDEDGE